MYLFQGSYFDDINSDSYCSHVMHLFQGSYSDDISTDSCKLCTRCNRNELMVESCTYDRDTICVGTYATTFC